MLGVIKGMGWNIVDIPGSYSASIFGPPDCSEIFEGLVNKIVIEKAVLYLMANHRPPKSASERCFCSRFLIGNKLLSKNLLIIGDIDFSYIDCVSHKTVKS